MHNSNVYGVLEVSIIKDCSDSINLDFFMNGKVVLWIGSNH